MTRAQFNDLKVGDRVYVPHSGRPGELLSTEVLAVDRLFQKATVLLGRRPYSYRYIRKGDQWYGQRSGLIVGMCS